MKKLSVYLRLGVVSFCFLGAAASAADKPPFAGFGVGLTGGLSRGGEHTIDLEVLGYTAPLADSGLKGTSLGLSLDYLYPLGNWRIGPRLKLEHGSVSAGDRIGNQYVNFETTLELSEMHSLSLLVGYAATSRFMPYVSAGVAASYGTIGARINVLKYTLADSSSGWVAGPTASIGFLYRLGKNSEVGIEYSRSRFEKRYERCAKIYPICAGLPVRIAPESINFTLQKRF